MFRWLSRLIKSNPVWGGMFVFGQGTAEGSGRDFRSVSRESYEKCVVAHRAISLVADSVANAPLLVLKAGREMDPRTDPLAKLLKRPNPQRSGSAFLEECISFRYLAGNVFIVANGPNGTVVGDTVGEPTELWNLHPDEVQIVPGKVGIEAYVYGTANGGKRFPVNQITGESAVRHWRTFNPTTEAVKALFGFPPIQAAMASVDVHNQSSQWNLSTLKNYGQPGGVLKAEGNLTKEQREFLRTQWDDMHSGSQNAGRPMILEGNLEFTPLGQTAEDLQWMQGRNQMAREIAFTVGVPPQLMGIPGDNTYSNYQEARAAFFEDTVIPVMNSFLTEINPWLCPMFGNDYEIKIDVDSITALAVRRIAIWNSAQNAAWLTINEKRRLTGYDPLPDGLGDKLLVSPTETPLGDVENPPDIEPDGAPGTPGVVPTKPKPKPGEPDPNE